MIDSAFYLVTEDIARRSGVINGRYRTTDNRYILDNKDLSRVRFTSDEYISGLAGVEKITADEAKALMAQNKYAMGEVIPTQPVVNEPSPENNEEEVVETPTEGTEHPEEPTEEETTSNEWAGETNEQEVEQKEEEG